MTKRDQLIAEFNKTPIQVGEHVYFKLSGGRTTSGDVVNVIGENIYIKDKEDPIQVKDVDKRLGEYSIGFNPFKDHYRYNSFNSPLDGLIFRFVSDRERYFKEYLPEGVPNTNWNPYVFNPNGTKMYYQRPLVWTLEDKQELIRSLYKKLECGRVVVRLRSYRWIESQLKQGNTEVAWHDIVDGKQRLHTVHEFMSDEFPDEYGYYWSDLSRQAQAEIKNAQPFAYVELPDSTTDKQTLMAFINNNHAGVPMDKNHLNFVMNQFNSNYNEQVSK